MISIFEIKIDDLFTALVGIHHTSLLGIWFAWTLWVLTLIFVKATRALDHREQNMKMQYLKASNKFRSCMHLETREKPTKATLPLDIAAPNPNKSNRIMRTTLRRKVKMKRRPIRMMNLWMGDHPLLQGM